MYSLSKKGDMKNWSQSIYHRHIKSKKLVLFNYLDGGLRQYQVPQPMSLKSAFSTKEEKESQIPNWSGQKMSQESTGKTLNMVPMSEAVLEM
jgi:hypothetical protein